MLLCKLSQKESFKGKSDPSLQVLNVFKENGLIRTRTMISNRQDTFCFRCPIVLDPEHPLTRKIVRHTHLKLNHAGINIMINNLEEKFWIPRCRGVVRSVIKKCVVCRRYAAKSITAPPGLLPENRVRDAAAFEVTGVDYAGPLLLREGQKAYVCLFACAVYRAVHLELVTSLSTEEFLEAFRRFIARRGRPSVIYSDNATNFVGASNLLRRINWNKISQYCSINEIEWHFNPPSAAWWGGWWERLVRFLKDLLKRTLKRTSLNYEEISTVLCDCEATMKSRPLTYLAEERGETMPILAAMFISDIRENKIPDLDQIDKSHFAKRLCYRHRLKEELRKRFRIQYLGQLARRSKQKKPTRTVAIGDFVLIGNDLQKRLDWPLAKVEEVFPGKDGHVRIVRLKTAKGELIRPIQRLIPLEVDHSNYETQKLLESTKATSETIEEPKSLHDEESEPNVLFETDLKTRNGRIIKKPQRIDL
ncbi:integrase core domain protein [Lasius niger]|uniref:Integrase core domain protein n=1 Tax=Lasius niger TaxID=67767 RepID=A0A0J7K3D2_LASNI|nr:integrase core domain protein [Lasius niger]